MDILSTHKWIEYVKEIFIIRKFININYLETSRIAFSDCLTDILPNKVLLETSISFVTNILENSDYLLPVQLNQLTNG